jgi:hypothetical protein
LNNLDPDFSDDDEENEEIEFTNINRGEQAGPKS